MKSANKSRLSSKKFNHSLQRNLITVCIGGQCISMIMESVDLSHVNKNIQGFFENAECVYIEYVFVITCGCFILSIRLARILLPAV